MFTIIKFIVTMETDDSIKGIFSDSNNILWHESELNKKSLGLLPKFQLIPILRIQVMHDYVHRHCSIDYCIKLSLVYETLCPKLLSFHKEMISAWFLWGNVLLRGELQKDTINSNFDNFESTLYMKSVSMPLMLCTGCGGGTTSISRWTTFSYFFIQKLLGRSTGYNLGTVKVEILWGSFISQISRVDVKT